MELLKSYFRKPILIIFFLGISSGIPLALILTTVKAFLSENGFSLTSIGFFSLVSLPYTIKILFAPTIDSTKIKFLTHKFGKRRSWMIVTQILLIISIITLGIATHSNNLYYIVAISFIIAVFSASQDIVVDAYRIENIQKEDQGIAASMYVYGYYIGMLFSGALALILVEVLQNMQPLSIFGFSKLIVNNISWNIGFYFISLLMFIGIFSALIADEKKEIIEDKKFNFLIWFEESVLSPLSDFIKKTNWYLIFLFILSFKLTDAFAGNLVIPFLLDLGFSKIEYAQIVKTFGLFATLFGSLLGGIVIKKIGMIKGLWIATIMQIMSNFGYYFLSFIGNDISSLYIVIFVENLSTGIGNVILVAYLSSLCNIKFSATQYALLVSIASISRTFLSSPAGIFAEQFGWSSFFLLSIILGIPSLILLYLINNKNKKKLAN